MTYHLLSLGAYGADSGRWSILFVQEVFDFATARSCEMQTSFPASWSMMLARTHVSRAQFSIGKVPVM